MTAAAKRAADRQYLAARAVVAARADGTCEMCGQPLGDDWECSHRTAKGMGGAIHDPRMWNPSNLMASCGPSGVWCNQIVERVPKLALAFGWKLQRWQNPETVPVLYAGRQRVLLLSDGTIGWEIAA